MKEQHYIVSAQALKEIIIRNFTDNTGDYCFSNEQIKQITNRQINDMIAAGDITPTIFEKE